MKTEEDRRALAIGRALATLRAARGWSQKELAAKIGIGPAHMSLVENGKRYLGISALGSAAFALGVLMQDILALASRQDPRDDANVGLIVRLSIQAGLEED